MKVQDVKRDGPAIVGLSVELSNSEVGSINKLLWTVNNAIETGIDQTIKIARQTGKQYGFEDKIPVAIDLRSLKKVQWLLYQLTRLDRSDLFNAANSMFEVDVSAINKSVTSEKI